MDSSKEFFKTKKKSPNKLRTKLLLLANDEIIRIKKTSYTQINSRNLSEFEKFYSDLNNSNAIELKEEKFVSRDFTDIIHQNIRKEKFILKSPDGNSLMKLKNNNSKENWFETDLLRKQREKHFKNNDDKIVLFLENLGLENKNLSDKLKDSRLFELNRKKSVISSKKNKFFRMNTLQKHTNSESENENNFVINAAKKIDYDKNIQLINFDDEKFLNLPQTKKRYDEGFNYLNQLARSLKLSKKKRENYKLKVSLDQVPQTIKEKSENENPSIKIASADSPSAVNILKDSKRNSNQSYKSDKTTNYILKINDEIVSEKNVKEFLVKNQVAKLNNQSDFDKKKDNSNCNLSSVRKSTKDQESGVKDGSQTQRNYEDNKKDYFKNNLKDLNSKRRKSTIILSNNFSQSSKHLICVDYSTGFPGKNSNNNSIKSPKKDINNNNKNNNNNAMIPNCKGKKSLKNLNKEKELNEILEIFDFRCISKNNNNNNHLNLNKKISNPNSDKNSKISSKNTTPKNLNDEIKQISPKRKDSNNSEEYFKAKTERDLRPPIKKNSNFSKLSSNSIKKGLGDLSNNNNNINNNVIINNNNNHHHHDQEKNQKKTKIPMNKIDFSKLYKKKEKSDFEDKNNNSCKKIYYLDSSNSCSNSDSKSNSEKNYTENENENSSNDKNTDYNRDCNIIMKSKNGSLNSSDSESVSEDDDEEPICDFNENKKELKAEYKPMSHREKNVNYFQNEINIEINQRENYGFNYEGNEEYFSPNLKINNANKNQNIINNFSNKNISNYNNNFLNPERTYIPNGVLLNKPVGDKLNISSNNSESNRNKIKMSDKEEKFAIAEMRRGSKAITPRESTNANDSYKKTFLNLLENNNNNYNLNGSFMKNSRENSLLCEERKDLNKNSNNSKDSKTFSNGKSNEKDSLSPENKSKLSNTSKNNSENSNNKRQENRKILNDSYSQFNTNETTNNSSNIIRKSTNSASSGKGENEVLEDQRRFSIRLLECNYKQTDKSSNEKVNILKNKVSQVDVKKGFDCESNSKSEFSY